MALLPESIDSSHPDFNQIQTWPFSTATFYEAQMPRLIREIPQRMAMSEYCQLFVFKDASDVVGFGSLQVTQEYTVPGNKPYLYIPVLAVNPAHLRKGYGKQILAFLMTKAVSMRKANANLYEHLLLDVYEKNTNAVDMYLKAQFIKASDPIQDDKENNETFIIMARAL